MPIIVDAFGGDKAPLEILRGCQQAVEELGVEILLTGKETEIIRCAAANNISLASMQILDAPDIMSMTDNPMDILKAKGNTSLAVGLKALAAGQGSAFVSAGSTGAIVIGATFIVKRIPGIKRAAIASILPTNAGPSMLIDMGANVDCTAEHLNRFAVMGDIYMKKIMDFP
ncbi:MAG TPA: phosphate--acyl-ACP acyltransferase, partial [Clostridia bacterium]|nr:phosphate--acyl-ACP acyltransferase [Clostridia bacterium]